MTRRGASENYVLDKDQRAALIKAASITGLAPQDTFIMTNLLYLGLRTSEAGHVQKRWLRIPIGTASADSPWMLQIPANQPCDCSECIRLHKGVWKPKSRYGIRTLQLFPSIRISYQEFLSNYPLGLQMHRSDIWRRVKKVAGDAGIKMPGLAKDTIFGHALRATCATMLAEGGMEAPQLQYWMGWADIRMAFHYVNQARMRDSAGIQAATIFDKELSPLKPLA